MSEIAPREVFECSFGAGDPLHVTVVSFTGKEQLSRPKEQIYVHAQRDFEEVVENDHRRLVRGNEEILVQGTRESTVAEDHYRTVRGNEVVTIEKDMVLHIVGRQRIVVEGRPPSSDAGVGSDGGEGPPAPTLAPADTPSAALAPATGATPSFPQLDLASQELARARLVWSMASLPADLQAQGAEIEQRTSGVALQVASLRSEVGSWLASGRPVAETQALQSRTAEPRPEERVRTIPPRHALPGLARELGAVVGPIALHLLQGDEETDLDGMKPSRDVLVFLERSAQDARLEVRPGRCDPTLEVPGLEQLGRCQPGEHGPTCNRGEPDPPAQPGARPSSAPRPSRRTCCSGFA